MDCRIKETHNDPTAVIADDVDRLRIETIGVNDF